MNPSPLSLNQRIYICLMHAPIYNKRGEISPSALTNLDVHDIARVSRTYDLAGFFIVHPIAEQRRLAQDIISHWTEGFGASYNEKRKSALSLVSVVETLQDAAGLLSAGNITGKPLLVVTKTKPYPDDINLKEFPLSVAKDRPIFLIFGTGWGLTEEFLAEADVRLAPVRPGSYNHLSVRSAVSIIVDRLLGD